MSIFSKIGVCIFFSFRYLTFDTLQKYFFLYRKTLVSA